MLRILARLLGCVVDSTCEQQGCRQTLLAILDLRLIVEDDQPEEVLD